MKRRHSGRPLMNTYKFGFKKSLWPVASLLFVSLCVRCSLIYVNHFSGTMNKQKKKTSAREFIKDYEW